MTEHSNAASRPSLFRLLAVMFYDFMVLLSILFLAYLIAIIINSGEAIRQGNLFFIAYQFAVSWLFYAWFWTHGGQTIGMRAWKIYLLSEDQSSVSWRQATIRFAAAVLSWIPLGLGFWWQYFGNHRKSWRDRLSATYLYYGKNSD
ncbi:MAG: RDD family protein [Methylophaga sp.]|nr:RDD family protein [Methylophaga sp.]